MIDVTLTVTLQEPGVEPVCAGTVPPINDNALPIAVTVPPTQVVAGLGELVNVNPVEDKSSIQAGGLVESDRANEFGL